DMDTLPLGTAAGCSADAARPEGAVADPSALGDRGPDKDGVGEDAREEDANEGSTETERVRACGALAGDEGSDGRVPLAPLPILDVGGSSGEDETGVEASPRAEKRLDTTGVP
ncbi:hypothetical protein HDU93_005352, partial [Gonapodya sp. JEL0774]